MAKKFVAPNLDNATPSMLIDELGNLSIMESQIKKMRAFYKEALFARTGIKIDDEVAAKEFEPLEGETFIMTVTQTSPNRFDQKAFEADDPATFNLYKKQKPQLTARPSLKDGATNPVVNSLLAQMRDELGLDDPD